MSRLVHERLLVKVARGEKLLASERNALHDAYVATAPGVSEDASFLDFFEEPRDSLITSVVRLWTVGWLALYYSGCSTHANTECQLLDVGAGRGELMSVVMHQMLPKGSRVHYTGIELDLRKVEVFRQLYGGQTRVAYLATDFRCGIPLPDGAFTTVVSTESLEHITRSEGVALLHEMRRVLKPGGHLILTTPDLEHSVIQQSQNPCHLYEWKNGELHRELLSAQFEIVDKFWFHVPLASVARYLPSMYPSRMHTNWLRAALGPASGERGLLSAFICRRPLQENSRGKETRIRKVRT